MGNDGIFEFQTMMATVQRGLNGPIHGGILTVGYVLMMCCFLLSVYEAFAKGGDTRQLVASLFKYIVVAVIVGNWDLFFTNLMTGFNQMAQYIASSYGAGDLAKDWQKTLSDNYNSNGYGSIWNMITNSGAAIFNALEIGLAYLIFPLATQIFTVIYILWGGILYAVGPLVLALSPSQMVNSTAKFYARNLVVWNCWSIIYAVLSCLIAAVNGKSLTTSPFFSLEGASGATTQMFIGLTSILYAVCILLIPVIAFAILKGEFGPVGSGLMGLVNTASQVGRMVSRGSSAARGGGGGARAAADASQGGSGGGGYSKAYSQPPAATPARDTSPYSKLASVSDKGGSGPDKSNAASSANRSGKNNGGSKDPMKGNYLSVRA